MQKKRPDLVANQINAAGMTVVPSTDSETAPCPKCATSMVLAFIAPHPMNARMEKHTYLCARCNQTRSYALLAKKAANHEHCHQIEEGCGFIGERDEREFTARRDFRIAELIIDPLFKKGWLTESVVKGFAKSKRIEEVIFAIARLAKMPTGSIERLIMGSWSSPVGALLKQINFNLETIDAIYCARLSIGEERGDDLRATRNEFMSLTRPAAERIMRFYKTRELNARKSDI